ncbi:MAG: hypothetical protein ABIN25_06710 [Ginsengibacter sp.]
MNIRIEPHTLSRAIERGASEEEIIETINYGNTIKAKSNRIGKFSIFDFNKIRNEKFYQQKKLEVFYVIENNEIITVTVYVFFGKFEI